MKENLELAFAALLIAIVAAVVIGACALLWPIRLLIDRSFEKQKRLCPSCAGLNRDVWHRLIYRQGQHICERCGSITHVELLSP